MRVLLFKVLPLDLCVIDDHELERRFLPFWEKCSSNACAKMHVSSFLFYDAGSISFSDIIKFMPG